ncbi:MAG: glycosyltransferase [Acidobacteria bacterium]|nr:MAG: glycosyltransferase [Acidobacteriota bacterium]
MKNSLRDLRVMVLYGWESNPYAESTIRALLDRKVKVDFVAREGAEWGPEEQSCTVHPIFPGHRRGRSHARMLLMEVNALARVLRLVLKTRPDIIHYQSYRMIRLDWILFLLLRLLRQKIVFTVHDTHSLEASRLDTFIFSRTARRSDILLVHSSNARAVLIERWKVKPERVRVIPHGGYDYYHPVKVARSEARRHLGYENEFLLLAFGTIRQYKGLDYLLPAVAQACRQIPALRLIIAGRSFDTALGARYQQQIADLGLNDIVRFENRFIETAEVEKFFGAVDLVVLPYIRIDQSGVLFLAYTFGKPVLVTSIGGLPEMVRQGESGYLVPPADSQALHDGILRAWAERHRLGEMGANARRLIQEEYTWERQAEITEDAYRGLLDPDRDAAADLDSPAAAGPARRDADRSHPSAVP